MEINNLKEIQEICSKQKDVDMEKVMSYTTRQELIDYMHSVYSQAVRLLESKYMYG